MGISIGIRNFEFPKWVEDVYDCMTKEERANNVKANIFSICELKDGYYEIDDFIACLSNRVTSGHDAQSCAIALAIADNMYPWSFLPGKHTKKVKCKHCGYKFETRHKDPRCKFCGKWSWSN